MHLNVRNAQNRLDVLFQQCIHTTAQENLRASRASNTSSIVDNAEDRTVFHYLLNDEKLQSKT